jgi:hypothetical protein
MGQQLITAQHMLLKKNFLKCIFSCTNRWNSCTEEGGYVQKCVMFMFYGFSNNGGEMALADEASVLTAQTFGSGV